MNNRLFCALLLLAYSITLPAPAAAQVFVQSHTNIETDTAGNRTLVASCRTQMLDGNTITNYPAAESVCMLNENAQLIQTVTCSARSDAFCATPTIAREPLVAGATYQTTSRHLLFFQRLTNFCTVNGVFVVCDKDPLTYGLSVFAPIPANRQITDSGQIFPAGGLTFWIGGNVSGGDDFLIGLSTETPFQSAQIVPFEYHTRANDSKTFNMNGSQNIADWTLIGTAGTLSAPLRGNLVTFNAPTTVPVQQVDTLKACKVDTSHGIDCDSAQITVEVVKVDIPAGNPNDIPRPDNSTELLGGQKAQYKATVIQGVTTLVNAPVTWTSSDPSGLNLITVSPGGVGSNGFGFVTVAPQSVFQNNVSWLTLRRPRWIRTAIPLILR